MDTTALSQLQITHYYQAADIVLFLCDYLQTFEDEVRYIWGSKWSYMKILFFIIRYTPFIDLPLKMMTVHLPSPSSKLCLAIFALENHVAGLGMTGAQVVFCVRAYALWGPNRTAFLCFSFFCVSMCGFGVVIAILFDIAAASVTNTRSLGCNEATAGGLIYMILATAVILAYDASGHNA